MRTPKEIEKKAENVKDSIENMTECEKKERLTGAGKDRPEEPQGEVWRINENSE